VGIEMLEDRETVLMVKGRNLLNVSGPDLGSPGLTIP